MFGEDPRTLRYGVLITVLVAGGSLWPLTDASMPARLGDVVPDDHDTPLERSL